MSKPRKRQRGRPAAAGVPSPQTRFEMGIRADPELNVTGRLLWLLVALSHRRDYTFMSIADMARQLGTTERQIVRSLGYILAGSDDHPPLFRQVRPIGVHRPRQYHRVLLPGEDADEFVYRAQADRRFDATVRLHWVASASTAATGTAEFSARDLGVSVQMLSRARRKMNEFGHFRVESDRERGRPARYTRVGITQAVTKYARASNVTAKPPAERTRDADRASATVAEPVHPERDEERVRRRRERDEERMRADLGLYQPVRPVRPDGTGSVIKKRRITSFK